MQLLIAVLIASCGSLPADWWASASPQKARAHWQEVAAGQPQKARAELVALLEAREADPAGRAALVWDMLRSGPEFRTSLAAVLANPASDGLVALLAGRSAGAVDLLHALAAGRENAAIEARTAALEALGRVGGRRERELLLTVLLDPRNETELRVAAGAGLLAGDPLRPDEHRKLVEVLDLPKPEKVRIAILHLVSRRPDPTVVHRLTLLAGSRRSGDYQAAALRAFVTACERADGDESTLAEARRGLAEIDSSAATPVRDAARLLARRWLEPELFAAEMRGKDASIADWRHYFADRHARSFWVDAVFEHGARRGESELRVVDRVLALLAAEPEGSPVYLPEVLFSFTERRPRWLVDGVLRKLEQGDAHTRLRTARSLAAVPQPHDKRIDRWRKAGAELSWVWNERITADVLGSLLVRALRREGEVELLVDGALAAILGQIDLEEALLDARLCRLREQAIESVLRKPWYPLSIPPGERWRASLWKVVERGSEAQRFEALERLVALREARAVSELAAQRPARVLVALFGGPRNRVPSNVEALTKLGVSWLDGDPEPPTGALEALLGDAGRSDEWAHLWEQLVAADAGSSEARVAVEVRLGEVCRFPATPEVRAAWRILASSANAELVQAARRRLARTR